jgi:hypothetical protein
MFTHRYNYRMNLYKYISFNPKPDFYETMRSWTAEVAYNILAVVRRLQPLT